MSRLTDWQIDEALRYCGPEPDKLIPIGSGYYRQALTELQTLRAENARLRAALEGISALVECDEYQLQKASESYFDVYKTANSHLKAASNGELSLTGILQTFSYVRGECEKALNPQEGGERE